MSHAPGLWERLAMVIQDVLSLLVYFGVLRALGT